MQKYHPKDFFLETMNNLVPIVGQAEGESLTHLVFEKLFQINRTDIILNQPKVIDQNQYQLYLDTLAQLKAHKPIQYIFQEAEFYSRNFYVDENVLIPRQETELLIKILCTELETNSPKILDIGTGSGCIACSLALEIKNSEVSAYDISEGALDVAKKNAELLKCKVDFSKVDILTQDIRETNFDLIVSNPPYVMDEEKAEMLPNVLENEPHLALFVENDNPLLFYKTIIQKAKTALKKGGLLFFEINEQFGEETLSLFSKHGYSDAKLYQDLNGKHRFASALNG